ncbi:AraC family transcriptional regulator [Nonomuraea sp. ZG12]|uniref:AraC family transcriptional regulator n=1 Tax=Nonomuraea sp. ZG12 TaxID=3452207 RepID=UPI003F8ADCA7
MSSEESVRYWRHQGLGGLHLMRARFVGHRFSRHSHETFAIGAVESGVEEIRFADGVELTGADEVVLIDPGVVHTGRAYSPGGWTYRVLYPSTEQLAAIGEEIGAPGPHPSFARRVVTDRRMARAVVAAHRAAETGDPLTADSRLRLLLARLLAAYGSQRPGRPAHPAGPSSAARARDFLHASLPAPPPPPGLATAAGTTPDPRDLATVTGAPPNLRDLAAVTGATPSLSELAAAAGATPFALLRAFQRAYGLPPHAYLTQLRVRRARELLERGVPPAAAAVSVGFCDQSHLSRHFRRIVGATPGLYQRAVQ